MNAHEARQQAEKANKERTDQSLLKIHKSIKEAVINGKYECYYYAFITDYAKTELIEGGYTIEKVSYSAMDGYTFKISW